MENQSVLEKMINKLYSSFTILLLFILAPFFSAIFIQKVCLSQVSFLILRILNKKIIFDFDDAIYAYRDIRYLLKDASAVVVSNDYLKEFACKYNNRVYKLISPVKVNNSCFIKNNETITLGWIGSPGTSKYLNSLFTVFKSLKEEYKKLNIIFMGANINERFSSLGIKTVGWSLDREKEFLESLDIGIMPLDDEEASRAKAGYKLLLYMSMGIPCVASPVGINCQVIKDGINGFLADSVEQWKEKLDILIKNSHLCLKMGQAGRKTVEELYSYEITTPKLIEVFNEVCNYRRNRKL